MEIRFTLHAEEKLSRLVKIGITKEKVREIAKNPDTVLPGYSGRRIAQRAVTKDLILRVVYEEKEAEMLIITVYPAERRRYE